MYALVMTVHIVVCVFLIIVVLLQSGQAADLAGAFGGMGSQTAFGPRGSATLLSKATTLSAVLFMITSLALSIMATRNAGLGTSVLDSAPTGATAPAVPKTQAPVQQAPPAGQPIPVEVHPQPDGKGGMSIDMSKIPVPAAPPAGQKGPAPAPAQKK